MFYKKLLVGVCVSTLIISTGCSIYRKKENVPTQAQGIRQETIQTRLPSAHSGLSQNTQKEREQTLTGNNVEQENTDTQAAKLSGRSYPETSDSSLSHVTLPAGFIITEFADVPGARSLAAVETETALTVFVGNRMEGNVYALQDTDFDLRADNQYILAQGRQQPNGVAVKDDDLYVAEIDTIHMFPDILDNLENPLSQIIYDDLPSDRNHGRKYIAFGPDGKLYIPIGAPCNNCDAGLPYAALHRLDLETKERELVAEGLRNTVGFGRHPQTGELRITDNGRDRLGDDLPPDELNALEEPGAHFGYPYCHGGEYPDDSFTTRGCDEFVAPFAQLGPHVAALGLDFGAKSTFPELYKDKVFIAEHGSRNRSIATGYRVSMVDLQTGIYETFAGGRHSNGRTLGRPVDVLFLSNGSLLVSDDYAGKIYAIHSIGTSETEE